MLAKPARPYHLTSSTMRGTQRILMLPRGGWIGESAHFQKFNPLSVLKPVRPVSKTGQASFTQTEPTICESPLWVLAQTKLGVGLPQGFPRVSMKSLHTTQAHQRDRSGSTRYMLDREINQQARYIWGKSTNDTMIYPVVQLVTKACLRPRCWGIHTRIDLPHKACPLPRSQVKRVNSWDEKVSTRFTGVIQTS
jgi:hypothetical protein